MAAPSTLQRLQKLIWVLIYGGLLTLVLGIATARTDAATGWVLMVGGGVVAAVGVVLIAVRARLKADPQG
ncbi:VIT1/CCC1 family predicted Fe2+/Mn2+ transporter [Acidovorax delafieldii]|uniref:VIT1/CCC1 family predicted Fe2+/Mn2+ transporter n=1 Tax=Acidovorax delafieldii TaxID=47920 RepID=A0AAJ2F1S5_ACIDE|nr:hypothetical protein [Acidovorax delafieldii]MDR6768031.1 VIT1/CCC1 family predicted Fe2+/Mn2+ transporter [Acidovorax delafieldii]MDR6838927.1 VIT1/CCC1 family predicted Fe2+/Mn2+ transporter [Acidovorax delafieldii]MDR7368087.1 VIT1/CCC1 family predicted Fe2+/Mn2+ transporter [Acidovorax delafieldii]